MSPIFQLLALSFLGSVAGLIGGVIFLFKKEWARVLSKYATPLAAGVLLALSLLDLLPEAVEAIDTKAFSVILTVFLVLFLIERFLFYLHHHSDSADNDTHLRQTPTQMVIFGDTIHNFLDGVAIAAAFLVNPSFGLLVATSAFLHETPHEIADFGILMANGWSRLWAFNANLFSSLATFPGALLTYFYAGRVESTRGILLSVAAALFLYVALTDFLPEVKRAPRGSVFRQTLFLVAGILIIVVIKSIFPEMGH